MDKEVDKEVNKEVNREVDKEVEEKVDENDDQIVLISHGGALCSYLRRRELQIGENRRKL